MKKRCALSNKNPSRFEVWKMFDAISKRYDLVNHILSFGIDLSWRKKLSHYLPSKEEIALLDLATGTGSQLIAMVKKSEKVKFGMGIDLSPEMIREGQRKIMGKSYSHRITLAKGDATALALKSDSFDCITFSFGIRNVTDVKTALSECYRVLKPGGRLLLLEFSLPKNRMMKKCHLFYLRHILPPLAGWIAKNREAYEYLSQTIETFPYGQSFCRLLEEVGFTSLEMRSLTLGVATLYVGDKPLCSHPHQHS